MTNKFIAPKPVELTEMEADLYSRVPAEPSHEGWHDVADAMEALMESLLQRDAVPDVRLKVFCDAEYAESGQKSPKQIFESNGTSGNEIFRHGNFVPYLRYFVLGPDLPKVVVDGLCKILNEDSGTSGMVLDQYRKFARNAIRTHGLRSSAAATEFFRLGLEIGMEIGAANSLRDAARTTK